MRFRTFSRILVAALLLQSSSAVHGVLPEQDRRYDQGPLKYSDFRKHVREGLRGRAKTMTRVMYQYRTLGKQTGSKRFEVSLKSLNAYCIFLPEQSWWNHRESEELLDHEQGHFDIGEIAARRLELSFRKALKSGKKIQGIGKTLEEANAALEHKLQKVIDLANEQSLEENRQYDQQTWHGSRFGQQAEFRRIQKLTLKKLAKELGGSAKAAKTQSTKRTNKSSQADRE